MTAQIPEQLILDGEKAALNCTPPLPKRHPRLEKVPHGAGGWFGSTACWRNYVGTWEVSGDRLYLNKVEGLYRLSGEGPLFADWVTGTLTVPRGHITNYVHMGFASQYEGLLYLVVRKGVVLARVEADTMEPARSKVLVELDELLAREELGQAYKLFGHAWSCCPPLRDDLWLRGYTAALLTEDKGIRKSFIYACGRLHRDNPADPDYLSALATMYFSGEDYARALPLFRKLLRMRLPPGGRRDAEYMLAMLYAAVKKYELAKKTLASALRRLGRRAEFFAPYFGLMGEIEGKLGGLKAARRWFDKACYYDPYETSWPRQCAELLEKAGDREGALDYWRRVLAVPADMARSAVSDSSRPLAKLKQFREDQELARRKTAGPG